MGSNIQRGSPIWRIVFNPVTVILVVILSIDYGKNFDTTTDTQLFSTTTLWKRAGGEKKVTGCFRIEWQWVNSLSLVGK